MASFLILHASDLHIASEPNALSLLDAKFVDLWEKRDYLSYQSSHEPDILEALAQFAYKSRKELDLVLLTGDLATTGDRADLETAKTRLVSPPKRRYIGADGGPTLGFLKKKLKLMPGNHDRFRRPPTFFPGGAVFDEVFADHWGAGQSVQRLADLRRGDARLVVLAADFTLATGAEAPVALPFMHFGSGAVYRDRLEELEARTAEAVRAGASVVWAVHFKPECDDENLKLWDDGELMKAAAAHGVAAVLCGHTHESRPLHRILGVEVAVCGTTTQDFSPDGNYLHLLAIDVPSGGGRATLDLQRLRYDDLTGFVP